ncbi:soluble scavenger receptor cysteine-rich domain-containing protein SSC5D [Perognathus longimembris pacificus]|uniref:soluble scavenger receptor cysteine-rich domain-containing protein SSC5D n=1 Tax=Perognathus longimembris pacificus TaxID=214514 RepID=UPI002019FB2F|nr:soluble scavenger receptor cysteine-rich domain-containing protein SSC5D [Perognathus longimembris pacificus]
MRVLACLLAVVVRIQAVEWLRLADGPHSCAGRLEVWHGGRWGTVCDDGWDLRDATVACRELGCGAALAAPGGAFFGEGTGPVWLSELACRGSEGQLGLCPPRGRKPHICSHEEDAGVVCAGQRVASSRDHLMHPLEGELWPGLSGELSPGSEEPLVTHAPRPAGSPQSGPRKKSPRPPKQLKSTRAPLLTTGAPHQERLRLVSGPHGCAGRLEVWHGGRWGTVCDDGWDLRDAAVACQELGCGGALAAPGGARFGPGTGPVWMDDVGCGGGEQALRDCPRSPWGRSNCDHSEDAGLVCTGPAPRLRLADGPHGCAGRLEVWHGGRWGTVCDDAWDLRDAAVACRELSCGGALAAPGGAFFGEGTGPIVLDDLRCRGNETALRFCPARPWGQHDCHHREDAGAVCDGMPLGSMPPTAPAVGSNGSAPREALPRTLSVTLGQTPGSVDSSLPPASPTVPPEPGPEAGAPQLRLVAGPNRCSGRLEVWHAGRWGTVCDDSWDLRDAAVVCRELGCGGPQQPDPSMGRFGWGAGPIWLDDVGCVGTEAVLSDCPAAPWGKHNCAHNEDVGVTCTGTPGLDTISDPFSWSWLPGLGRDPDAWLPGELATRPSASLTPSELEKTTTKAPGKTPKSTKKWVTKNAKRPTPQSPRMTTMKRARGTQSPPELTSQITTPRTTQAFPEQTSELPKRVTPEAPREWTSTQGPGDMASKVNTKQSPQASLEPSAQIPEQSSESPKDLSLSPTASAPTESGPFHLRLADGPNRCAGRLEVWHAGRWGTVCDDSWDLRDAAVVCHELGCGNVRPRVGKTHYGPGSGPIWLDDMGCKGSETSLIECPSRPWGMHNCDHEEDVGLTCTGYTDDHDYPPWTWDPTSGEDLGKETTTSVGPRHTLSWGTPQHPRVPSPAARRLPHTGSPRSAASRPAAPAPTPSSAAWLWPSSPPLTSGSTPRLLPNSTEKQEMTGEPSSTSPTAGWPLPSRPGLPLSTPNSEGLPALSPGRPFTPPTSRPPALSAETPPFPTSELLPESDPPQPTAGPEASGSPDLSSSPSPTTPNPTTTPDPTTTHLTTTIPPTTAIPPTMTPHPSTVSHPTTTSHPSTIPHPTTTHPAMTPHPSTISHSTMAPHPTTTSPQLTPTTLSISPQPTPTTLSTRTPGPTPTLVVTTKSLPGSLGTELPSAIPPPRAQPSLHPQLTTSLGSPPNPTSQMPNLEASVAAESSLSGPSAASSVDPPSPEDFRQHRSKDPKWSHLPTHNFHSASDPTVNSDLHLPPTVQPLDSPDQLTLGQSPGPLGPCVSPTPPVRVMACEPPALGELVAAVREVGEQLHRLTQVLEQDRQERQALGLGLGQLVKAAQGLGQLGETVKRLAEVAWPPTTPVPISTTPEEEERPLRGDV